MARARLRGSGRRNPTSIWENLSVVVHEQNVLRLQVRMNQIQVVENYMKLVGREQHTIDILTSNTGQKLTSKALNVTVRKRRKVVTLKEIEDAHSQQVSHYADMVPVVETVAQMNALVAVVFIVGLERGKHT